MSKDNTEAYQKGVALRKSADRWMTAYWITLFSAVLLLAVGYSLTDSFATLYIYSALMITSVGFYVRSVILTHKHEDLQREIWKNIDSRYMNGQNK